MTAAGRMLYRVIKRDKKSRGLKWTRVLTDSRPTDHRSFPAVRCTLYRSLLLLYFYYYYYCTPLYFIILFIIFRYWILYATWSHTIFCLYFFTVFVLHSHPSYTPMLLITCTYLLGLTGFICFWLDGWKHRGAARDHAQIYKENQTTPLQRNATSSSPSTSNTRACLVWRSFFTHHLFYFFRPFWFLFRVCVCVSLMIRKNVMAPGKMLRVWLKRVNYTTSAWVA